MEGAGGLEKDEREDGRGEEEERQEGEMGDKANLDWNRL